MLVDSDGDLIEDYAAYLKAGSHLAVMPIARVEVGWAPLIYPGGVTFYPTELADLRNLNVVPISKKKPSLADVCSAASGINTKILSHHPLIVFPYNSDWEQLFSSSHNRMVFYGDFTFFAFSHEENATFDRIIVPVG